MAGNVNSVHPESLQDMDDEHLQSDPIFEEDEVKTDLSCLTGVRSQELPMFISHSRLPSQTAFGQSYTTTRPQVAYSSLQGQLLTTPASFMEILASIQAELLELGNLWDSINCPQFTSTIESLRQPLVPKPSRLPRALAATLCIPSPVSPSPPPKRQRMTMPTNSTQRQSIVGCIPTPKPIRSL